MAQVTLHPTFAVTQAQLLRGFEEYEQKGKRRQRVSIGEEKFASIPVIGQLGNRETLKLSVTFLSPLAQARRKGYEFGSNARSRTAADRASAISRLSRGTSAYFELALDPPRDRNIESVDISFGLLSKSGNKIAPSVNPQFDFAGRSGSSGKETLTFNVGDNTAPRITNNMAKLVLVIGPSDGEQRLEFNLNNP